jgi:hypothetical protein
MNKIILIEMAKAYEEADENDYAQSGNYEGCRPDEIARKMVREILKDDFLTTPK